MRLSQRYTFEENTPRLEEICDKIKRGFNGFVEVEDHSAWRENGKYECKHEDDRKNLEKHNDGETAPFHVYMYVVKAKTGETITLYTFSFQVGVYDVKHINLESDHTKNTYELYEFAGELLKDYGGKIYECTEEQIREFEREKKRWNILFACKIVILIILYFVFHLTILQIFAVVVVYLVIKFCISIFLAYRTCKKQSSLLKTQLDVRDDN